MAHLHKKIEKTRAFAIFHPTLRHLQSCRFWRDQCNSIKLTHKSVDTILNEQAHLDMVPILNKIK